MYSNINIKMIDEHFKILLENNWSNDEKNMIERIMNGLLYFKKLLPKILKDDVIIALKLCNELKTENEKLKRENNELKNV